MEFPHLSRERASLHLRELRPNQILTLCFVTAGATHTLIVKIEKPAGSDPIQEPAFGIVLDTNHPNLPPTGTSVKLVGCCTADPNIFGGIKLYTPEFLTLGRNLVLGIEKEVFFMNYEIICQIIIDG